ncbi:phosphoglycerate dehydrogenase [Acanthopleuribacter pedis]|uniref:D-3-phosphoglycerate dehydrogenase n=1 Tax=Acanthopleuribacter pedis TaxID=442870 RepID=A0A8J7U7D4_9BACT|nr:phosphoglycerate dehydrogenase [Acanthopleuribacter pedis]MBO1322393.1 phosphoglycerate dehydrogenase [Acanthopleuribacter pedis]
MTQGTVFNKEEIKIVLFEGISQAAVEVFGQAGYTNVELLPKAVDRETLLAKLSGAHMIGIRSRTQLKQEILEHEAASRLMAVGCFCIGTNQVNLPVAATRGVPVFNAPHSNTRSVAELVIGHTIMMMRKVFPNSMAAHRKQWNKSAAGCYEVRGKTIGIIGYGHIGSQVSVLAEAMGMKVIYYDVLTKLPLGNATQVTSMQELLKTADVVSLHVPATPETKEMMGAEEIALMREGSYLINASRGNVVVVDALAEAIRSEKLLGAAVDVFPKEPASNTEAFESPLVGLESVILTPHIGGSTQEAQRNIGREVAGKLINYCTHGSTIGAVNFPGVNLTHSPNTIRLLHIHHNRPGVLQKINDVVGDHAINVLGQYLRTTEDIGFVVLDIDAAHGREKVSVIRDQLSEVPGTIRTRKLVSDEEGDHTILE